MRTFKKSLPMVLVAVVVFWIAILGPAAFRRIAFAAESGRHDVDLKALTELSKYDTTSPLFRAVAKAVKPAVVVVKVKHKAAYQSTFSPRMDDFLKRFLGENGPDQFRFHQEIPAPAPEQHFDQFGLGSGVIVDAKKGYVLTNWHVVHDADNIEVVLSDNRKLDVEWVRTDQQTDLAIIKIKPDRLIAAPLGDSDRMDAGNRVLAFGAPEGLPQTVTAGIVSGKGRTTGRGGYQNFIQTDAAINHGNSGGPLVNMRGEIIGINAAIISRSGGSMGIGLAIPSNMAKHVMRQLIDKGRVVRGYLGVTIQDVDGKLAKSFDMPDTQGALVAGVAKDTPAEKAGLKEGDFIVEVAGKSVRNVNELRNRIAQTKPGASVKLSIYRDGKKQTIRVKIAQQPKDMAAALGGGAPGLSAGESVERYGLKVAGMNDQYAKQFGYEETPKGVVVLNVAADSPAADQSVRVGQVITQVQGKKIHAAEDLIRALSGKDAASGVRMRIRDPRGGTRFIFLTPRRR
jgi:serine protease Do